MPLNIKHALSRLGATWRGNTSIDDSSGTIEHQFKQFSAAKSGTDTGYALQKAIIESANFSSIATDAQGVIQLFNVGAECMLGYTALDVINKITPAEMSDPQEVIERATALSQEMGTAIAPGFEALVFKASQGIEDIYELTYIRKDGSRFPAVVSVTALRDAEDVIIGYLLISTDNTARKLANDDDLRANDILREAQLLAQATLDASWAQICVIDNRGTLLTVNQAWREVRAIDPINSIGLECVHGVGSNYLAVCERAAASGDHEAALVGAGIKQVLSGELLIFNAEYAFVTAQGPKWFKIRARRFAGDSGNAAVAHEEITLRKLTDIALAETAQHTNRLNKGLNEVIWGASAATWEWNLHTGMVIFNARWAELVGYTREELEPISAATYLRLCHPLDHDRSMALLELCFRHEAEEYECELRIRHKSGAWIWVLDKGRVVEWSSNDKPLRISGTRQDISMRKMAENELEDHQIYLQELVQTKTSDLTIANRTSQKLLERASVAERRIVDIGERIMERIGQDLHDDLGQHLTGIALLSKLLFLKLQSAELPEQRDADQITKLLNEAVAKTRVLAQGLYPVSLEEVGLCSMLKQLATNIEDNFGVTCKVLHRDTTSHENLALTARFNAPGTAINLYRIAQEAISNSIKHGHAKKISIAMFHQFNDAVFQISDDGFGMVGPRQGGLGMHTMRYRAMLIDATLTITKIVPHGVRIKINLSMQKNMPQQLSRTIL